MNTHERLNKALTELHKAYIDCCSDLTTGVVIRISCHGYNTEITERMPVSLRADGISMRNLKGDWIK